MNDKEIKRFTATPHEHPYEDNVNGEYVLYSDHKKALKREREKIAFWLDNDYIASVYMGRHRVQHDIANKIRKGEHDG